MVITLGGGISRGQHAAIPHPELRTANLLVKEYNPLMIGVRNTADDAFRNLFVDVIDASDFFGAGGAGKLSTRDFAPTDNLIMRSYDGAAYQTCATLIGGEIELALAKLTGNLNVNGHSLIGAHGAPLDLTAIPEHGAAKHTNVTRELFLPANEGSVVQGVPAAVQSMGSVTGGAEVNAPIVKFAVKVPDDFVSFVSVKAVWLCSVAAAGNMYWKLWANYGAAGESAVAHVDEPAYGVTATGGAGIINVQEPPTPLTLASLAIGDYLGIAFDRDGSHANDTLDYATMLLGILFTYTAEQ